MANESSSPDESAAPVQPADPGDPLRLVLHTMEEQLDDRVGEVADAKPARDESTQELIRLEETLSSAQDKAKQLVTLRLKLGEGDGSGSTAEGAATFPETSEPDISPAGDAPRPDLEETD